MDYKPSAKHITKIKGKDYLGANWRIVWFRADNPNGRIETSFEMTDTYYIARAEIYNGDGIMLSSDFAQAPLNGQGSWSGRALEKAITSAKARALANVGYSTEVAMLLINGDISNIHSDDADSDFLADKPQPTQQQSLLPNKRESTSPLTKGNRWTKVQEDQFKKLIKEKDIQFNNFAYQNYPNVTIGEDWNSYVNFSEAMTKLRTIK